MGAVVAFKVVVGSNGDGRRFSFYRALHLLFLTCDQC